MFDLILYNKQHQFLLDGLFDGLYIFLAFWTNSLILFVNYYWVFCDLGVYLKFLKDEGLKLSTNSKSILRADCASPLGSAVCKAVKGVFSDPLQLVLKLFIAKLLTE